MFVRADHDLKKTILMCIGRTIFCGLLIAYALYKDGIVAVALIIVAIWVFLIIWPLRHLKDYAEFHEDGICCKGDKWSMGELGKICRCTGIYLNLDIY